MARLDFLSLRFSISPKVRVDSLQLKDGKAQMALVDELNPYLIVTDVSHRAFFHVSVKKRAALWSRSVIILITILEFPVLHNRSAACDHEAATIGLNNVKPLTETDS